MSTSWKFQGWYGHLERAVILLSNSIERGFPYRTRIAYFFSLPQDHQNRAHREELWKSLHKKQYGIIMKHSKEPAEPHCFSQNSSQVGVMGCWEI